MILYLAGPMSGRPEFNRPAFWAAEAMLAAAGHQVLSPARITLAASAGWLDYMREALVLMVARGQGVAVLPGWETSRGARIEANLASDLGLPVLGWLDWLDR